MLVGLSTLGLNEQGARSSRASSLSRDLPDAGGLRTIGIINASSKGESMKRLRMKQRNQNGIRGMEKGLVIICQCQHVN